MKLSSLTYAHAGETPESPYLEVVNLETGALIRGVIEVDCAKGSLTRYVDVPDFSGDEWPTETLRGRFALLDVREQE